MTTGKKFFWNFRKCVVMILTVCMVASFGSIVPCSKVYAGESAGAASFRKELAVMLETGDTSVHNIAADGLSYSQMLDVFNDLTSGDCIVAYSAYTWVYLSTTKSNNIVQTVHLTVPDNQFASNYVTLKKNVSSILSGVNEKMTNADKALYLHDALLKQTVYKHGTSAYGPSGPLVNGYGVCEGYSAAYRLLLSQVGIQSEIVQSSSMNHAWIYAQIDGKWYNIDPTWDDTFESGSGNGTISHESFLLTDTESKRQGHQNWIIGTGLNVTATDATYSGSAIHSALGNTVYADGIWYYVDGEEVKATTVEGKEGETVFQVAAGTTIESVAAGVITCSNAGQTLTYSLAATAVPEVVPETAAKFFLVKEGGSRTNYSSSNYYSLGSGTIKQAVAMADDTAAITANLGTIPDTSSYVKSTQTIVWYSVKLVKDGWHVDGQVITVANTSASTAVSAEIQAKYFLVKEGGSRTNYSAANYYSLGTGTIKQELTLKDDTAAITANLGTVPDTGTYVSSGQTIEWYSIKKVKDGWHVDGQIVKSAAAVTDTSNMVVPAETQAKFFLVKEGGSRTDYSAANYYSLGTGTIKQELTLKDDTAAITANLGTVPDTSSYVSSGQTIVWYSIKKVKDGWHVDGQVVASEDIASSETVTSASTSVPETVTSASTAVPETVTSTDAAALETETPAGTAVPETETSAGTVVPETTAAEGTQAEETASSEGTAQETAASASE